MRQFTAKLSSFRRDHRGFAAFEMAIIAPILLLVYFGTVDLANWYMAHRRLVVAGSTIADLTTQSPGTVTGTEIRDFWTGIGRIIEPLPIDSVTLTMRDYRKDGGSSKRQWSYSSNATQDPPAPACGSDRNAEQLLDLATTEMSDANDILIAEVCTTISPIALHIFGFEAIPLKYQISMRPRLGKTLDCTSGCS